MRIIQYLLDLGLRLVVVATKIDLVAARDRPAVTPSICRSLDMTPEQIVAYSSQTGEGRQRAWGAIQHGLLSTDEYDPDPNAEVLDVGELFE
jgi:GTP-binding protein EngB required for normal cell division